MMTEEQLQRIVLEQIGRIAPEADIATLDPAARLRDQFDFDSVDFINFAVGLQTQLGVTISEADYPHLATVNGCIAYLSAKCGT